MNRPANPRRIVDHPSGEPPNEHLPRRRATDLGNRARSELRGGRLAAPPAIRLRPVTPCCSPTRTPVRGSRPPSSRGAIRPSSASPMSPTSAGSTPRVGPSPRSIDMEAAGTRRSPRRRRQACRETRLSWAWLTERHGVMSNLSGMNPPGRRPRCQVATITRRTSPSRPGCAARSAIKRSTPELASTRSVPYGNRSRRGRRNRPWSSPTRRGSGASSHRAPEASVDPTDLNPGITLWERGLIKRYRGDTTELSEDAEEASLAQLIIGYFQVNLWRIGSIGGVGGTRTRVVTFLFLRSLKISPGGLKSSARNRSVNNRRQKKRSLAGFDQRSSSNRSGSMPISQSAVYLCLKSVQADKQIYLTCASQIVG